MSILLVVGFIGLVLFLISQFGGSLSARNSLVWWMTFLFLLICLISPGSLAPIAHALGIQLVSNLVLASMLLFLVFQAIQESAFSTKNARKLRDLISTIAAENFLEKHTKEEKDSRETVVIGMPCYNEKDHLPTLSGQIKTFQIKNESSKYRFLFLVVNDGSTDRSRKILTDMLSHSFTNHLSNIGVAGALLTSFKVAEQLNAKYVIQCDSDGQHPIDSIPQLVDFADSHQSDLLIGSRHLNGEKDQSSTAVRRLGSVMIICVMNLFSVKNKITDPTSGFRVYSQKARAHLLTQMPDEYPEPESIALLMLEKMKVDETQVTMNSRQGGVSSLGGIAGARFMIKVISALIGLRLRTLIRI